MVLGLWGLDKVTSGECFHLSHSLIVLFQFSCREYLYPFLENGGGAVVLTMPGALQITVLPTFFSCFSNAALLHFGSLEKEIFFPAMNCQHKFVGASPMAVGGAASPIPPENQHEFFISFNNSLSHCILLLVHVLIIDHLCSPVPCPVFFTLVPVPRSQHRLAFPRLTWAPAAASSPALAGRDVYTQGKAPKTCVHLVLPTLDTLSSMFILERDFAQGHVVTAQGGKTLSWWGKD